MAIHPPSQPDGRTCQHEGRRPRLAEESLARPSNAVVSSIFDPRAPTNQNPRTLPINRQMVPLPTASTAAAPPPPPPPTQAEAPANNEKLRALEERLAALEAQGPGLLRVQRHCRAAGVESAVYKWVPADYYDRPMGARAVRFVVWVVELVIWVWVDCRRGVDRR